LGPTIEVLRCCKLLTIVHCTTKKTHTKKTKQTKTNKQKNPNKQIMISNDHITGLMCHGMAGERLLFHEAYSL
jgi:hypothetical protein